MRLAPVAHCVEQRPQRFSERSNGVYHSRRRVRVYGAVNNPRALQIAELLGKRSLRDPGNTTLQFGEPLGALEKLLKNGGFPASADNACGGFHRTKFWTLGHIEPSATIYTRYRTGVTYFHVTMRAPSSSILTTTVSGLDLQAAR